MQKDYLKEISAVQTLLILKGAKIEFKEMFKFILLDLLELLQKLGSEVFEEEVLWDNDGSLQH